MAQSDDSKTVELATESNTDREGCYDVFLSFHDSDTGYGFCDYLYRALCDADISTFRMHEEPRGRSELDKLKTEEEIYQAKAMAIEECKVAVVILSERYGESKWCLRDLTKIAARRRKDIKDIMVIPIFYYVNTDEVKAINSDKWCYKKFFDKYEEEKKKDDQKHTDDKHKDVITDNDLKEWRIAFKIFTGDDQPLALRLKKDKGPFHSDTVKEALKSISRHVARRKVYVSGPKSKKNEELKLLISKTETQNVRIIIVVGPSGSGKTNIVGHTYNEEKRNFESHHCFLKDVGCISQNDAGTMRLQQKIVSDIRNRGTINVENIHEGSQKVIEVIGKKRVFIVLDNVNSKLEIERLVNGGMDTFEKICEPGSLFIITTTNKDILSGSKLIIHICKVDPLPHKEASILFCQHAFKTENPPEDFDNELINDVVLLSGGLPLTLVILGSLIFNEKNKDLWKAMFDKIKDVPCTEAHDRLRIGYDALDYAQKQIFLDIACFFAGTSKEYPIYMWENCGFHPKEGIKILQSRSLVTIGKDDNIISMNVQLIKLGRQIVKEKSDEPYYKVVSKRSRLWDQHEALEVLTKFQRAEKVEALNLNMKLLASDELEKLQLIEEEYRPYMARVAEKEQEQNKYIRRLQSGYFRNLSSLRFLQLGQVSLYGEFQQLFSKLKWLQWTCCEDFIKHGLSYDRITAAVRPITFSTENLVILDLSKSTITDEWEHWESFKVAKKLKVLDLSFCDKIRNLDCSKQTELEVLNLLSCTSLTKLIGLEKSKLSLKYLNVGKCSLLVQLPDFSGYKNIRKLYAQECPAQIRGLHSLKERNCQITVTAPVLT